jgi:glycerate-2-kinase
MGIYNAKTLTSHGNTKMRRDAVAILEAGLQMADPYNNTLSLLRLEGDTLYIGNPVFEADNDPRSGIETVDLNKVDRILVVGAGKGVQRVALAIEDVLGHRLSGGHVIGKHGDEIILKRIGVTLGAHPTPDENCAIGCREILALSKDITERDLVFTITANGVSSLLTLPFDGIGIDEVKELTRMMQIEKGVPTFHLNIVRNHIDRLKGGKISRAFHPARMIHIVAVDANRHALINPRHDYNHLMTRNRWLHNLPEGSTFAEAVDILRFYDAWERTPKSIRDCLVRADPAMETVKADEFERMNFRVFGVMPESLNFMPVARKKAEELGYSSHLLTGMLQAEARDAALTIAAIARSIEALGEPFISPVALFSTGELLVTVGGEKGVGGRNQEFVLTAAEKIEGSERIVVASVDTDGTDGPGGFDYPGAPSCLAGGIVDGYTAKRARQEGVDIRNALRTHATSEALWRLESAVHTGQNISLCDFTFVLVEI